MIERMRLDVMRHMLKDNLGLLCKRQGKRKPYSYFFISDIICESCVFESAFANNTVFPLYLYIDENKKDLYTTESDNKKPNISPKIYNGIENAYGQKISPEDILNYIYGVFYSNIYRETYAEFLEYDFPRVPFTADGALFQQIAALGKRLIDLHLLRSPELEQPIARFEGKGEDLTITTPKYDPKTSRVWINATHYLEGIAPEVWHYQIGGYQVLDKYLKERKSRSLEDPRHILRVATALAKTIEVQHEIDALYPRVEENLITF